MEPVDTAFAVDAGRSLLVVHMAVDTDEEGGGGDQAGQESQGEGVATHFTFITIWFLSV